MLLLLLRRKSCRAEALYRIAEVANMSQQGGERLMFGMCCYCHNSEPRVICPYSRGCASCCRTVQCLNHVFCENDFPGWVVPLYEGSCMNCSGILGNGVQVETRPIQTDESCVVCTADSPDTVMMKFPATEGCTHWYCLSCCRDLILWREQRYHLDPRSFGCPPCPNGCNNPSVGMQCYCEEYEAVQAQWELAFPKQWVLWSTREHESIEADRPGEAYGKKTCPQCKRQVKMLGKGFMGGM